MSADLHCGRLAGVPIALDGGETIDLSHFCGQKLIVFFCPAGDPDAAAREIDAYEAKAPDFEHAGAWVIGIRAAEAEPRLQGAHSRIHLGTDAEGAAFRALARFVPDELGTGRGATFLIDRDGGIRAAWPGCGHARQALEIARERP
jgi:peroxiredoxin